MNHDRYDDSYIRGILNAVKNIAVVGATGAVGAELLRVLERRRFPVASLRPIGSARSAGKTIRFYDDLTTVEELTERSFDKIDIAFDHRPGHTLCLSDIDVTEIQDTVEATIA